MNKMNLLNSIEFRILLLLLFTQCSAGEKKNSPNLSDRTVASPIKPIVNPYIENSGSMDGYVKGVTEFEQAVYSYLSDIKISEVTDSLNLLYLNCKPIPWGLDIADFIEKLEPSSFKLRGGDRKKTDILDLLQIIINETKEKSVSILISDCIYPW